MDILAALRETAATVDCRCCEGKYHPAEMPDLPRLIEAETADSSAYICMACAAAALDFMHELCGPIADTDFLSAINAEWRKAMRCYRRRINAALKAEGIPGKIVAKRKRG